MTRVFPVKIDRSDRDKPDTFYFRADSRAQAEAWLRDSMGAKLIRIHPPRTRKKTNHLTGESI